MKCDWFRITALFYVILSVTFGVVCCAWTWHLYESDKSDPAFKFAVIGTLCSSLLIAGLISEFCKHYVIKEDCCKRASSSGFGMMLAHAGIGCIGIFSVCVSAVVITNENTTGLYTLSYFVIAIQVCFCWFCIPCNYINLLFQNEQDTAHIRENCYMLNMHKR